MLKNRRDDGEVRGCKPEQNKDREGGGEVEGRESGEGSNLGSIDSTEVKRRKEIAKRHPNKDTKSDGAGGRTEGLARVR